MVVDDCCSGCGGGGAVVLLVSCLLLVAWLLALVAVLLVAVVVGGGGASGDPFHIWGTLILTNIGYTNLSMYTLRSLVVISSVNLGTSSSLVREPIKDRTSKSSTKSE